MKTRDIIIHEQIGLRIDAPDLSPMDKGECMSCMSAYLKEFKLTILNEFVEKSYFIKELMESYGIYHNEVDKWEQLLKKVGGIGL